MNCEVVGCKNKAKMDVTMPTALGIFTAGMCIRCGLKVHDDKEMFFGIIRDRAEKRKIVLPTSVENMRKLLEK